MTTTFAESGENYTGTILYGDAVDLEGGATSTNVTDYGTEAVGDGFYGLGATSIAVHIVAWQAYDEQGDKPRGDANRREAVGLLRSILASGDGASPVTAMKVVTVAEEYAVLEATGKTRVRQALVRVGDHQYDVLDATGRDGSAGRLYFSVNTVRAGEDAAIGREISAAKARGSEPTASFGAPPAR